MRLNYKITDIVDYINWAYFFHAWGLPARMADIVKVHGCDACRNQWIATFPLEEREKAREAVQLYTETRRWLGLLSTRLSMKAVVEILPACSDGDDIVVLYNDKEVRLPMLRQQIPGTDGYCRCLADFIRPRGNGMEDRIGIFATSVSSPVNEGDDYHKLLTQTLADRLAEAAAECLHEQVRKRIWGYAAAEDLTIEQMHSEQFVGTRPAVGYPSMPDMSMNFQLDKILNFRQIGVSLTEHGMMQPHASVSGLMISHPQSCYFDVGSITEEQLLDYARRRELPAEQLRGYVKEVGN